MISIAIALGLLSGLSPAIGDFVAPHYTLDLDGAVPPDLSSSDRLFLIECQPAPIVFCLLTYRGNMSSCLFI